MTTTKTLPDVGGGAGWAGRLAAVDGDREGSELGELADCLCALAVHADAVARRRTASAQSLVRFTLVRYRGRFWRCLAGDLWGGP
jgi:hypothetical protein